MATTDFSNLEKGTVLLIHGSAPFNEDGRVPDSRAGRYSKTSFYKNIASELEKRGWKVVRYSKLGVSSDRIDFDLYKRTDVLTIGQQLQKVWETLPSNKPRLVFAWSEGSLHAPLLPLKNADGVIILGGISTNIRDVVLWQAGADKEKMVSQLEELKKMPRDEMLGLDRPAGRLVDELALPDNWRRLENFNSLPILVLHGEADKEVPLSQALVWQDKLGSERVTCITKSGKNHMLGDGETDGASTIASEIDGWWKQHGK